MPVSDAQALKIRDMVATPRTKIWFETRAPEGGVFAVDTSTTPAVLDLRNDKLHTKWITIHAETEDIGFFMQEAPEFAEGVTPETPLLAARVGSSPERQCARIVAGGSSGRFVVDPRRPILAYVGAGVGVMRVELTEF